MVQSSVILATSYVDEVADALSPLSLAARATVPIPEHAIRTIRNRIKIRRDRVLGIFLPPHASKPDYVNKGAA